MAKIARIEAAWKTGNGLQLEAMKTEQAKMEEEQAKIRDELEDLKRRQKETAEELEDVARQGRKIVLVMNGSGMKNL